MIKARHCGTWPGPAVSHRNVSYSMAKTGALSLTSITVMRVIPFPTCDGSTGTDRHVLELDSFWECSHVSCFFFWWKLDLDTNLLGTLWTSCSLFNSSTVAILCCCFFSIQGTILGSQEPVTIQKQKKATIFVLCFLKWVPFLRKWVVKLVPWIVPWIVKEPCLWKCYFMVLLSDMRNFQKKPELFGWCSWEGGNIREEDQCVWCNLALFIESEPGMFFFFSLSSSVIFNQWE